MAPRTYDRTYRDVVSRSGTKNTTTIRKGDTSRSGLRGDAKGGGYTMRGSSPISNSGAKRDSLVSYDTKAPTSNSAAKTGNLAGYMSIAPSPKVAAKKTDLAVGKTAVPTKTAGHTLGQRPGTGVFRKDKYTTAPYATGDYAAYRASLAKKPATTVPVATAPAPAKKQAKQAVKPAKVVTNVKTNYGTKPTSSAAKAKPTGGSMRTTPTRTGGGLQSRAARDAAIGPSRSSYGGGNRSSAGPSRSSAGPSRSGGGGNLGGARGRISEPGGSKK